MLSYKRFKTALLKKSFTYEQAKELLSNPNNAYLMEHLVNDSELVALPVYDAILGQTKLSDIRYPTFVGYFLRLPYGFTLLSHANPQGYIYNLLTTPGVEYFTYTQLPKEEIHRTFRADVFDYTEFPSLSSTAISEILNIQMLSEFPAETEFLVSNILSIGRDSSNRNYQNFCVINSDASKPDFIFYLEGNEVVSAYNIEWDTRTSFNNLIAKPLIAGSEGVSTEVIQSHFFNNQIIKELTGGVVKYRERFSSTYTTVNVSSIVTANARTLTAVLDTYIFGTSFHILGSLSNGNPFVIKSSDLSTWTFHEQFGVSGLVSAAYTSPNILKYKRYRNTKLGEKLVSTREFYTLDGTTWQQLPSNADYGSSINIIHMYEQGGKYFVLSCDAIAGGNVYETTDFIKFLLNSGEAFSSNLGDIEPFVVETNSGVQIKTIYDDDLGLNLLLSKNFPIQNVEEIEYYDANLDLTVFHKFALFINDMIYTIPSTITLGTP